MLARIRNIIMKRKWFTVAAMLGVLALKVGAWDYEGHHVINELALASLPADFGGFKLTPALKHRIAFLGASRTAGGMWAICR